MLVTVITPTYNRVALLQETIESVLAQDYPNIEYLVLDDGSTDGTQDLLAQYQGRLTVIHHPNMGETRTVNKGFMMARGDIVSVINSDDPLLPGAISRIVHAFKATPDAVAVYPDWAIIDGQHRYLGMQRLKPFDLENMLLGLNWGLGPGTFIRREAIKALGGRNTKLVYCGDMEFWLHLARRGKLAHVPKVLATHRVHADSASLTGRGRLLMSEWVGVFRGALQWPDLPPEILDKKRKILSTAYRLAAKHYAIPGDWVMRAAYLAASAYVILIPPLTSMRSIAKSVLKSLRMSIVRPLRIIMSAAGRFVFRLLIWFFRKRIGACIPAEGYPGQTSSRFAFSTRFVPPLWSGQSVVIGRLLKDVPEHGYRLVRLPLNPDGDENGFIDRLPGKTINLPAERSISGARFSQWLRVINLLLGIIQRGPAIARALKDEGIDTIVGCSGDVVDPPAAFLAARILGCRFFFYFFDDYTEQWWAEPRLRSVVGLLEGFIARRANGLISPNEFMRDELDRRYGKNSHIIRNPCPWNEPSAIPAPHGRNAHNGEFRIVFTGAVYHLNYDIFCNLLRAIETLDHSGVKLHIYTAQPAEELARQGLVSPLLEVHGHVTPDEAARIQQEADILLIPFSFAKAAAGIVKRSATAKLADYLMAGGPVLAICPEDSFLGWYLSTHQCGSVVTCDDAAYLAKRINELIHDPGLRETMRRNAKARARIDFSPDIARDSLLKTIGFSEERPQRVAKSIPDPMSVVQISGYDTLGIQVNGFLLHKFLEEEGHSSRMLVYKKMSRDPGVMELGGRVARKINRLAEGAQKVLSTQNMLPVLSSGIHNHPWIQQANIVNLQLVHNAQFFSLFNLPQLSRKRRVVLSVHDMFLFTGHCIYSMDCTRWQTGCGTCPDLDLPFKLSADTSAINWKLKKWVFDRSHLDLVVGAPWQRERVSSSPILSRFPLHYIPYGVDTRIYKVLDRQRCREELGIPFDAQVISFRSVPFSRNFKGTEYIEQALQACNPKKPTVLLTFEGLGGLESLRKKYRVVELGWVSDQEAIARALNAADLFLMPSIAEGFGLMAIESMACGTPVIVFEGTALPETINAPKCGIAVPARDSAALARAIEAVLDNDVIRGELRENALRHVAEKHTFELYAGRYLDLYRELAKDTTTHV